MVDDLVGVVVTEPAIRVEVIGVQVRADRDVLTDVLVQSVTAKPVEHDGSDLARLAVTVPLQQADRKSVV